MLCAHTPHRSNFSSFTEAGKRAGESRMEDRCGRAEIKKERYIGEREWRKIGRKMKRERRAERENKDGREVTERRKEGCGGGERKKRRKM